MSAEIFSDLSAALLLGGASLRMGHDKGSIELAGEPASTRLARFLRGLSDDVVLVGGAPSDCTPGRAVPDPPGSRSALRGLVGALRASERPKMLVVATDYYGLELDLLVALLAYPEADVVVPRDEHHHPLCALYRRAEALEVAEAALVRGELRLDGVLDALHTRYLEGDDLARVSRGGRVLRNVNTPADFEAFQREQSS